jgi:hypothetical protein
MNLNDYEDQIGDYGEEIVRQAWVMPIADPLDLFNDDPH